MIKEYRVIFFLNAISFPYKDDIIAPFEQEWGKVLRRAYRKGLKQILTDVEENKNDLSLTERLKILGDLRREYKHLAGRLNIFYRRPCKSGKVKVRRKLNEIRNLTTSLKEQAAMSACFNIFGIKKWNLYLAPSDQSASRARKK